MSAATGKPLQCSLGTAWVGNFTVPQLPERAACLDLVLPSPVDEGRLVLRVPPGGNVPWNWGLDVLIGGSRAAALRKADAIFSERLLPPAGLVAFPGLVFPNSVDRSLPGDGMFHGLSAEASRADMVRAIVAGLVFEFRTHFERVTRAGRVDRVILGGGASKGWWFQQLFAGLFAPLPVYVAKAQELTGARGAVYAFGPRAARARQRRVAAPRCKTELRRHYDHYARARRAFLTGIA